MDDDTTTTSRSPLAPASPSPVAPESRHVSVWIDASPDAVYALASDPAELPRWAAGLADPSLSDAVVDFAAHNEFGVLDHVVRLPSGEAVYNPMRVIPGETGCEVVFTLRRRPGVTDAEFEADAAAVATDLETLRGLLEN
ncbi:MAG: Polyketide cyclase / dehydrase and lipid transport [Mycobacterium sp.]|jgi:uncharacterized protein YndB with AHSA1/START domain|nr:Polyketide cyclase / dehydrase and lipid transport [Mycobacterium sp.]